MLSWSAIILLVFLVMTLFKGTEGTRVELTFTEYQQLLTSGQIASATIKKSELTNYFFRLMSVFYPPDERFISFGHETEALTFWVAACGAAARVDLRARFKGRWGYPIDDAYYENIFPLVKQRAAQRDPVIDKVTGRADQLQVRFRAIVGCDYAWERSVELKTWSAIQTNTATQSVESFVDRIDPAAKAAFYRVTQIH